MKILITGARSGIGYKTGLTLAKLGNEVILTVRTKEQEENLKKKIEKYQKLNLYISCFKLDIKDESDRKKITNLDIDCLINNAAIGYSDSILEIDLKKLKENFEVNVFSTIRLSQIYAADLFANKRKGKIIFISSITGIIPIPFLGSYSATKASLITLATTWRKELKLITENIQVKLILPGIYNTGFNDYMFLNNRESKSKYFDLEVISLKRKQFFKLIGKNNLNSIVYKIVNAVLDNSNKFIYKAPFLDAIIAKFYMLFFRWLLSNENKFVIINA